MSKTKPDGCSRCCKNKKNSEKNDSKSCSEGCKTCKCQNSKKRSTGQKLHLFMLSEPQVSACISLSLEKKKSSDASSLDLLPDYHHLLPRYLQDVLKRAARSYPDHSFSRLCEIERVMQVVKSEFPQGFKHEDPTK